MYVDGSGMVWRWKKWDGLVDLGEIDGVEARPRLPRPTQRLTSLTFPCVLLDAGAVDELVDIHRRDCWVLIRYQLECGCSFSAVGRRMPAVRASLAARRAGASSKAAIRALGAAAPASAEAPSAGK